MKCSFGISDFLEEISSLSHSVVFLFSLHWSLKKAFLSLLAVLWKSAFRCLYLSFSPLLFASLLFTAICKASPDSHYQGKLEVVKQEMARVNIDILGISELKWMGMGKFNSDGHYIYYCGQESLRRNWIALTVNESLKCSTWVQFQKWQNVLGSFLRQTIQYHSNRSLCPNHYFWGSWSWMVIWRPIRPSRTNTKKKMSFSP